MKKECVNFLGWHRQVLFNVLITTEQKRKTKTYIAVLACVGIVLFIINEWVPLSELWWFL